MNKAISDNVEEIEAHFLYFNHGNLSGISTTKFPNVECFDWSMTPLYTVEGPYSTLRCSRAVWVPALSSARTFTWISGVVRWLAMQRELS